MHTAESAGPNRAPNGIPPHLDTWQLPPGWSWGSGGVYTPHRHSQEVIDALGRSLALVTAPDSAHHAWLFREARLLAHRNHPSIPTTYHFWQQHIGSRRGPGYLRRWITGETIGERLRRSGEETVPFALRMIRAIGSTLAYLHDSGSVHGALAPDTTYFTPTGRPWLLGWQWAVPKDEIPEGISPDPRWFPMAPEWGDGWVPTQASDQWQLGAIAFAILTGEVPSGESMPPIRLARPDCPVTVAELVDRMLSTSPAERFSSVAGMLRRIERISGTASLAFPGTEQASGEHASISEEDRLRWATGDDYEVLSPLGTGSHGSVWRVRDLSLEREVALKMLNPIVAKNAVAVERFRREAQLAAQLQHPAIVPIFAWDSKGDVNWYIMELEEAGSVADLVRREGPRPFSEIAPQVDAVLDGLSVAHANGIIHRDLKPENILIDRYRRWRIADFGIANALGVRAAGASGTPAFAAPEQLLGEEQGVGTDLFAIAGIVIYALTGRTPFAGGDGRAILAAQLAGRLEIHGLDESLDESLGVWLRRATAADPAARFADADAMRAAWRGVVKAVFRDERRALGLVAFLGDAQDASSRSRTALTTCRAANGFCLVLLMAGTLLTPVGAQEPARPGSRPAAVPLDSTSRDSVPAQKLGAVRVDVARSGASTDRLAWAVGVQTATDLRRGQATLGIDEALANIPGVVVSNRYNHAVDQRLSIRGAGSRANFGLRGVKVLLDGIPQSLPDGQSQLTNVDLAAVSRVEVLRGSASSLYGNGSGGVIAFTTDLSAPDRLGVSTRFTGGSFGTSKSQARVSARSGNTVGAASASRTTVDGFRQYSGADVRQLMTAVDHALSDRLTLAVRAGTAETPMSLNPGALTTAEYALRRDTAALNNVRRGASKEVSQRYLSVQARGAMAASEWSASVYGQRRLLTNALAAPPPDSPGPAKGIFISLDRRVTGFRLDASREFAHTWRPRIAGGIDLQRAFDVRRNERATGGRPTALDDTLLVFQSETQTSVGPFAQVRIDPHPRLTLSVGGRWDRLGFRVEDHFLADGADNSGTRHLTAATGHVGAVWRAAAVFVPYANIATAFESPTTTELAARPDGQGGFNPALGPQRIRTIELGARGRYGERVGYEIALFDASATDAIVQYLETAGRAFFRNAGRTQSRGVELGVTARPADWLELRAAWTHADYRFDEYRVPSATQPAPALDTLDGNRMAGVPRNALRLGARATWGDFTLDADHGALGALWGDDRNTVRVDGWGAGQLNVRATWTAQAGAWRVEPFVSVQNALDTDYVGAVTVNGLGGRVLEPAPLRHWYAGVEVGVPIIR